MEFQKKVYWVKPCSLYQIKDLKEFQENKVSVYIDLVHELWYGEITGADKTSL